MIPRFLLALVLLVPACDALSDDGSGDSSAQLACRDFYALAGDADISTTAETRARVQSMYESYASISETPGIADSARDMLAGLTSGDLDQFEAGVDAMSTACADVEPL